MTQSTLPVFRKSDFVFPFNESSIEESANFAAVQAFVLGNLFHDIMYHFGFDPSSGNFQEHSLRGNHSLKGDGDYILIYAQDHELKNNANFATGPDGTPGILRLGVFHIAGPKDSSVQSDVMV